MTTCPIRATSGKENPECKLPCEWYVEKGCVMSLLPEVLTLLKTIADKSPENEGG